MSWVKWSSVVATNGAEAAQISSVSATPAAVPNRRAASRTSSTQPAPARTQTSAAGSAT